MKKYFYSLFFSLFILLMPIKSYAASDSALNSLKNAIHQPDAITRKLLNGAYDLFKNGPFFDVAVKLYKDVSSGAGTSDTNPYIINNNVTNNPTSIVNYNNTLNLYSVYNSLSNSYEYINNIYEISDYYVFETTSNNFICYSFSGNSFQGYIVPISNPSNGVYLKQYFQLPDGRSSLNLSVNEINGQVFNYSFKNYNRVPTSTDLAIFHLDGDLYDTVSNNSAFVHGSDFVEGRFGSGFRFALNPFSGNSFNFSISRPSTWTVDFWFYNPTRSFLSQPINNPSSGQMHLTYDYTPAFTGIEVTDCWYFITIRSDGHIFVNNNDMTSNSDVTYYFNHFFNFDSSLLQFKTGQLFDGNGNPIRNQQFTYAPTYDSHGGLTSYGYYTYYPWYYGVGSVIDEVRVRSGIYNPVVPTRQEPYDLPYAYVAPSPTSSRILVDGSFFESTDKFSVTVGSTPVTYFNIATSFTRSEAVSLSKSSDKSIIFNVYDSDLYNNLLYSYPLLGTDFGGLLNIFPSATGFRPRFQINDNNNGTYTVYFLVYPNTTYEGNGYVMYSTIITKPGFTSDKFFCNCYFNKIIFTDFLNPTIAIQSPYNVRNLQIGGVRPNYPEVGDTFVSLFGNSASSIQMYYQGVWNEVTGGVFYDNSWHDLKNWDFSRMTLVDDNDVTKTVINNVTNNYDQSSTTNNYDYSQTTNNYDQSTTNNYYDSSSDHTDVTVDGPDLNFSITNVAETGRTLSDFFSFLPRAIGIISSMFLTLTFLPTGFLVAIPFAITVLLALIVYKVLKR